MAVAKRLFELLAVELGQQPLEIYTQWLGTQLDLRLDFRTLCYTAERKTQVAESLYRLEDPLKEPKFFNFLSPRNLHSLNEALFGTDGCFVIYDTTLSTGLEMLYDPRSYHAMTEPEKFGGQIRLALSFNAKRNTLEKVKDHAKLDGTLDPSRMSGGRESLSSARGLGEALGSLLALPELASVDSILNLYEDPDISSSLNKRYEVSFYL